MSSLVASPSQAGRDARSRWPAKLRLARGSWGHHFARRVSDDWNGREDKPFTRAVADEAQDPSVPQLRMLAALVPAAPDALFFAGDLGQRIFQHPYSWLALGVDVRGRSHSLLVNYRTSHQIRRRADVLLPRRIRDVDGYEDTRAGTISVFDGPEPEVRTFADADQEVAFVGAWLRARAAVKAAGAQAFGLTDRIEENESGRVPIGTMHRAKGLEIEAVAVMACDDELPPLDSRIEQASDESELDEIWDTERHLLYVAITRARDEVAAAGVAPASEFLADLGHGCG